MKQSGLLEVQLALQDCVEDAVMALYHKRESNNRLLENRLQNIKDRIEKIDRAIEKIEGEDDGE